MVSTCLFLLLMALEEMVLEMDSVTMEHGGFWFSYSLLADMETDSVMETMEVIV